jgi:rhamnosyl/mannosyltransferase
MKVVHIFKDCYPPTTGGIEQHMSLLCRRLAQSVDVAILAPSRSRARIDERLAGVRIVRMPEFGRFASVPLCPTAPWELRRLRPDLVHLHFPNPMGDYAQFLGGAGTPFVLTYHADVIKQKAFLPLYRPVQRILFRRARMIIFSAHENIPPSFSEYQFKCRVIPFGVEPEAFDLNDQEIAGVEELRRSSGSPIVLFVGAARYYKGIQILLQAMAKVRGCLILAGRGTDDDSLRRLAGEVGAGGTVRFCGEVSASRLRILMQAADIFVLPSINACETFGICQLEAMACSKPVVSTDLPTGVRSVNRHGITGLVVPPGEPDALAEALSVLASNPGLRAEFGRAGRRRVEQEFSAGRMVSKTLEVYREVFEGSSKNGDARAGNDEARF